ncbi:MAG TPA: type IX secretion system membrane protein PorP/SprF [Flavobacteriales bacterium]|nr:type IX secretion system membrane protein PorP/SprF [Flavobacteriales bacterium]HMW97345.1 type IX secretion system membrane protein PorP/SprF [Flavobacteriales bacterium]HNE80584.1 type IX secretion system membrane protein PorP/SprF [Flavobacteriales bacterium]HNI03722.1 type IX secretion system membrane protein PorP/SprF [Flavobacteriales bacterium]HNK41657.1 type IX secretion system membrane protein PorP/SprF [Flavobacteriales bacterium]
MRTGRHIVIVLAAWLSATTSRAQQDPMYSQYMFNTLAFNPAYAGSADVLSAMILSRHQWVGFAGAPSTQTLTVHSPLPGRTLSLGGTLIHDVAGPAKQNCAFLDVAYRIRAGQDARLSFGLKGGINFYQADIAALTTVDPDPINANISGKVLPNVGFGIMLHSPRYYVGLSAPKLLENTIGTDGGVVTNREFRHFFLQAGYVLDLSRDLKFKPSIMARAVQGAPISMDLNANFLLRDKVWFGAMYRLGNGAGVMAQYNFNEQLRAGYAFDLTTTRIGAYNAGTHEIMLSYDFRFDRGRTISPRYF